MSWRTCLGGIVAIPKSTCGRHRPVRSPQSSARSRQQGAQWTYCGILCETVSLLASSISCRENAKMQHLSVLEQWLPQCHREDIRRCGNVNAVARLDEEDTLCCQRIIRNAKSRPAETASAESSCQVGVRNHVSVLVRRKRGAARVKGHSWSRGCDPRPSHRDEGILPVVCDLLRYIVACPICRHRQMSLVLNLFSGLAHERRLVRRVSV